MAERAALSSGIEGDVPSLHLTSGKAALGAPETTVSLHGPVADLIRPDWTSAPLAVGLYISPPPPGGLSPAARQTSLIRAKTLYTHILTPLCAAV